jgi:ArsR family metal-binding transcriptional regulator
MDRLDTIGETMPTYYYKNGKKPTMIHLEDGTKVFVSSTNGGKFTNSQLKEIKNSGEAIKIKNNLKDKILERLEKRKAQKLLEQKEQQRLN